MKHKHQMSVPSSSFSSRKTDDDKPRSTRSFRRLSYYIAGGIDPTGRALDTTQVSYDSESDLGANCGVDALADPRVSFFDMVESVGKSVATDVLGSASSGYVSDASEPAPSAPESGEPTE